MKWYLIIAIVLPFIFTSCKRDAGPRTTEYRTVGVFDKLDLAGSADLILTDDSTYDVKIEAGANLLPYIKTEVNNGVLRIYEKPNMTWNFREIRIWVSTTYLDRIVLAGSGSISGNDFVANSMEVGLSGSGRIVLGAEAQDMDAWISGSGRIEMVGEATNTDIEISGSGDFEGRSFETQNADIMITGSGKCYLTVWQDLFARITGSGDVIYYGDPATVQTQITGSGSVIRR